MLKGNERSSTAWLRLASMVIERKKKGYPKSGSKKCGDEGSHEYIMFDCEIN